ncbi:phospholipase D-like domain-containing protein [Streptomyces tsukubensis]|uniref:phospholipase D-like domain-containing protein n=1 Tax=Streptomyces tsukubensis TaxID=83656 RepID=UPI0036C9F8C0
MSMRAMKKTGSLVLAAVSAAAVSLAAAPAESATSGPGASVLAAAAVPVSPAEVHNYTWFSNKNENHDRLVEHVVRLVDAAPQGATLSLTLYYFDQERVTRALERAAGRGVRVRIVVDGYMVEAANVHYRALKAIRNARVVECDRRPSGAPPRRACMSNRIDSESPLTSNPVMHNKFMTISRVRLAGGGTARNVLYLASANLDGYGAYESALTMSHAGLYQDYLAYFNDLMEYGSSGRVNNNYGKTFRAGPHRVYTFPRREARGKKPRSASNDPIAAMLKSTSCGAAGRTLIQVANFRIGRKAIAAELVAARQRGCQVSVVTSDLGLPGPKALHNGGVQVRACNKDPEWGKWTMHEKFLIVRQDQVPTLYVGSQNLTYRGLRQNDEAVLSLYNHPLAQPYQARFNFLYQECKVWTPRPGTASAGEAVDTGRAG